MTRIAAIFASCLAGCTSPLSSSGSQPSLNDIRWLTGCWETASGTREIWRRSDDEQSLIGEGQSPRADGSVFKERLSITEDKTGLTYTAQPGNSSPTVFRQINTAEQSVVFANPSHDYPQKIAYQLSGSELTASISDMADSKVNNWVFTACQNEN